jgi:protein involved in polysaccharide export with SLBB domain
LITSFINVISQVNLNELKRLGISSENDLSKLGLSKTDIERLKNQYYPNQQKKEKVNILTDTLGPIKNEKKVEVPAKQSKKTKPDSTYGSNIFGESHFVLKSNNDRLIPPSGYVLGTGDRISITIWGATEYNNEFTLDKFGNLSAKLVGRVNLKGKTFEEAKQIIRVRFGKYYNLRSSNISVGLSYSKIISVNVVGEVKKPGTYSVPSVNSAFNILSLSGGATSKGSLRNIEIRRNGETIGNLDVYKFLNNPANYSQFYLQDGDFIIVKAMQNIVSVSGEVLRNGRFEIKKEETFSDLLEYIGGFSTYANLESINLIRIENNTKAKLTNYNIDELKENSFKLQNGDHYIIQKIQDLVYGKVEIKGAINVPGLYQFKKGDKIYDLVKLSKDVSRDAYLQLGHILRIKSDLSREIIAFNLGEIMKDSASSRNLNLNEFDIVRIYSYTEFEKTGTIKVNGSVNFEGEQDYFEGMTLRDVILRSGGLLNEADKNRIQIERVRFSEDENNPSYVDEFKLNVEKDLGFEIKKYDQINFRTLPEFNFPKTIEIVGEVRFPGVYSLKGKKDKLLDMIERSGGVTNLAFLKGVKIIRQESSLGVIIMDLQKVLVNKDSPYNIRLFSGDKILIPKNKDYVSISGAIGYNLIENKGKNNKISVPYFKGKRAKRYVKKYAGGINKNGNKKEVYVVRANGQIKKSNYLGLISPRVKTGDHIIIPERRTKQTKQKAKIDWNSVIDNWTIKLTGIATLYILVASRSN